MARTISIRTTLGALALGTALALPGLQLAQALSPRVGHAAAFPLQGTWVATAEGPTTRGGLRACADRPALARVERDR